MMKINRNSVIRFFLWTAFVLSVAMFALSGLYSAGAPVKIRSELLGSYAGNVSYGFDSLTLFDDSTFIHREQGKYSTIHTDTGNWKFYGNPSSYDIYISYVYLSDYVPRHLEMIDPPKTGRQGSIGAIFCNATQNSTGVALWVSEDKVIFYLKRTYESP